MTTTWIRVLAAGLVLAVALMSGGVAEAHAQAARSLVQEGNRLYEEGRFAEAHQKYLEAMAADPESPVVPFNDGSALYRSADYQRAMEAYRRAIESGDPALASAAWYNLGNALYRQRQLEQSLEAYKQALRLNPRDRDAKYNFERVLREMQQQQEKQEQNQDQNQDEQHQDQDQDQAGQPRDPSTPEDEGEEDRESEPGREPEPPAGEEGRPEATEEGDDGPEPPAEGEELPEPATEGEGQPEPERGPMTPEEAERLLDAIEEDPGDVNRKPLSTQGRRPGKPW